MYGMQTKLRQSDSRISEKVLCATFNLSPIAHFFSYMMTFLDEVAPQFLVYQRTSHKL